MSLSQKLVIVFCGAAMCVAPVLAQVELITNGSMELGEGPSAIDPQVADKWTEFGINAERSPSFNLVPVGPGYAFKVFGDGASSSAGGYQEITGFSPGQSVTASVKVFSPANDKLGGTGQAGLVLEFLNGFGGILGGSHSVYVLDDSSPADTWLTATFGPFTAPANTVKVRITCRLQWTPGDVHGAAYWDDARVTVGAGPNTVLNGNFETAGHSPGQSSVGIDDWVGFNDQEKSGLAAHEGLYSLQLGTREAYSGLYQNMGVLSAGEHIILTAYVRNPSTDPLTGSSRAGIKLEFDPNGNVPPPEENLAIDEDSPTDEWIPIQLNTTVPPLATIARIVCIYVGNPQTTGAVYFDTARAERGSSPGNNQLLNGGFQTGVGGAIDNWTEFNGGGASEMKKSCLVIDAHDGTCCARATGPAVAGIFQEIAVTPGESLAISAFIQSPDFEALTGTGTAGLKIEWAVGGIPADIDIGEPGSPNTIGAGAATNTWIPLTIDFTMPPGTSAIGRFVNIIEKGSATSGRAFFDSCSAVVLNRCSPCDANCDGSVNLFDIEPFVDILSSGSGGCSPCAGDANSDGSINLFDISPFVDCLTG